MQRGIGQKKRNGNGRDGKVGTLTNMTNGNTIIPTGNGIAIGLSLGAPNAIGPEIGPVIGGAEIGVHKGQGLSPIVPTIPTGQRNRIPVVWCFVRWSKWAKWTNQTGQIGGRGVNTGAVLVRLVRLVSGDADEAEVDRVEEGTDDGSMVISESEMSERATVWACDGL